MVSALQVSRAAEWGAPGVNLGPWQRLELSVVQALLFGDMICLRSGNVQLVTLAIIEIYAYEACPNTIFQNEKDK